MNYCSRPAGQVMTVIELMPGHSYFRCNPPPPPQWGLERSPSCKQFSRKLFT